MRIPDQALLRNVRYYLPRTEGRVLTGTGTGWGTPIPKSSSSAPTRSEKVLKNQLNLMSRV